MRIDDEIVRLGGLEPVVPEVTFGLAVLDQNDIEHTLGTHLPDEYVMFVRKFGGHRFVNMVRFSTVSPDPVYLHPIDTGLPNKRVNGSLISHFYGSTSKDDPPLALKWAIKMYRSRLPDNFLPIADDGLGNQLCIAVTGSKKGHIYFWNHENEWDEDDYLEGTGEDMPEDAKYQNLYLVADTLEAMFKRLQIVQV